MDSIQRRLADLLRQEKSRRITKSSETDPLCQEKYYSTLREILRFYQKGCARQDYEGQLTAGQKKALSTLARKAFQILGGQPEPATISLKQYDHIRYGPYLGVSGEASAAPSIISAAHSSPKVKALGLRRPIEIGVSHDAERLGSVGELPVGPEEYRDIRLACMGRVLTSTNVGARLNVRYYARFPIVWVNPAPFEKMLDTAVQSFQKRVTPFLHTPDGHPRPIVIFIQFRRAVPADKQALLLRELKSTLRRKKIGDPGLHRVGLLAKVDKGKTGMSESLQAIRMAGKAGIREVILEGAVRGTAEDWGSMPGLLEYFNDRQANTLLTEARKNKVRLSTRNKIDTETVTRQVWCSLMAARNMGLELGKYGLFPLSLEESDIVVRDIQGWLGEWTAAPAFYVDLPYLANSQVFDHKNIAQAVRIWLRMVSRHGVSVVLIDTVDKGKGKHLLRRDAKDKDGILSLEEIRSIDKYAGNLGIHALWAGGITMEQVYIFGRIGVFGIYVTTATAELRPVTSAHTDDAMLVAERLPVLEKISAVILLLEAGFLSTWLKPSNPLATSLDLNAKSYLATLQEKDSKNKKKAQEYNLLVKSVVQGWKEYIGSQ